MFIPISKLRDMSLLQWIEKVLETITPNVSHFATTFASVASVLASVAWVMSQALSFIKGSRAVSN